MNSFQRLIQPLNPVIGFSVNSIQKQIQPLNPQIVLNVNYIQRQIEPLNPQQDSMLIPFKVRFNH